ETTPPARRPTRKPGSGWPSTARENLSHNLDLIPREGPVMSPRWFLVAVLASPMLRVLTSGVAARPETQEPKAGKQEGRPARADAFVAPPGRADPPPAALIGYTEHRPDLPGGRHANVKTSRTVVVKADGTGRRVLAEELTREAGYSTQFVGWSPDGKAARLSCDWKSDEVGKWEEEHKDFRTTGEGVRHDAYLIDLASGKATKQAPVEDKTKSELIKSLVHGRSISPDGKRSAFEDPGYRLYLAA